MQRCTEWSNKNLFVLLKPVYADRLSETSFSCFKNTWLLWIVINVNYGLQLTTFRNAIQGLPAAMLLCKPCFWSCRYYSVPVCLHVCMWWRGSKAAGWLMWLECIFLCNQRTYLLLSSIAVLHPCVSLCFVKMKKMIVCFLLLFAHTLFSTVMAKDLPGRHFTRRRDVSTQSLLGKLHTKYPKHYYQKLSQTQMIKGISSWPNLSWISL